MLGLISYAFENSPVDACCRHDTSEWSIRCITLLKLDSTVFLDTQLCHLIIESFIHFIDHLQGRDGIRLLDITPTKFRSYASARNISENFKALRLWSPPHQHLSNDTIWSAALPKLTSYAGHRKLEKCSSIEADMWTKSQVRLSKTPWASIFTLVELSEIYIPRCCVRASDVQKTIPLTSRLVLQCTATVKHRMRPRDLTQCSLAIPAESCQQPEDSWT